MAKQKKLTFAEYDKLDKQFSERKQITLAVNNNGQVTEYKHTLASKFKTTEIHKLAIDYLALLQELRKEENVTAETFLNAGSLLNALIVKYFSDVPIPSVDSLHSVIRVSNVLVNLGIMDQLFDGGPNSFDKNEIEKISKEIEKLSKPIGQNMAEMLLKQSLTETGEPDAVIQ
jgi:hypothetical protein